MAGPKTISQDNGKGSVDKGRCCTRLSGWAGRLTEAGQGVGSPKPSFVRPAMLKVVPRAAFVTVRDDRAGAGGSWQIVEAGRRKECHSVQN